jgi:AcrR family transcriptional regulator
METASRRTRAEQTAANRAAVLDAAWQVFCEVGYNAASLDRIAEVAGFSKGVVYSRFGSKADLFLALLERRIEQRAAANAVEADAALASGGDVIAAITRRMVLDGERDHGWRLALLEFRLAAARDHGLSGRYASLHADTVQRLADLVDAVASRTGIPPVEPAGSLATVVLALDAGLLLEALGGGDLAVEHRVEITRRVLQPAPTRAGTS